MKATGTADEYMHELGLSRTSTRACTSTCTTRRSEVGGFFRLGNRANEGYAEMTTCIYLPDGRVGFMFNRPKISDNDAFDAGGLRRCEVTPFEELTVDYDGKVVMLDDPLAHGRPEEGVHREPVRRVRGGHHLIRRQHDVRRRARRAPREARRRVRQGSLRAA